MEPDSQSMFGDDISNIMKAAKVAGKDMQYTWAMSWENMLMICIFVVRSLDRMQPIVAEAEIPRL